MPKLTPLTSNVKFFSPPPACLVDDRAKRKMDGDLTTNLGTIENLARFSEIY